MPRISEIDPAHAPEAIQKTIADHVSDGHALTAYSLKAKGVLPGHLSATELPF